MTALIGLCGAARSGKDTFADILSTKYRCASVSFAEPMRVFACNLMGIDRSELDDLKEISCDVFGGKTPRYALQTLGTEWGRRLISDSLWVDVAMNRVKQYMESGEYDFVLVTDVRFVNEAEAIKPGNIVYIDRPGVRIAESNHSSEAGIPDEYKDYTILNNGTLEEYEAKVFEISESLLR